MLLLYKPVPYFIINKRRNISKLNRINIWFTVASEANRQLDFLQLFKSNTV